MDAEGLLLLPGPGPVGGAYLSGARVHEAAVSALRMLAQGPVAGSAAAAAAASTGLAAPVTTVVVCSRLPRIALEHHFGNEPFLLAAEGGAFVRAAPEARWECELPDPSADWMREVLPVVTYFAQRTPGSILEVRETSVSWHYGGAVGPAFAAFQARDLAATLAEFVACLPVIVVSSAGNNNSNGKGYGSGVRGGGGGAASDCYVEVRRPHANKALLVYNLLRRLNGYRELRKLASAAGTSSAAASAQDVPLALPRLHLRPDLRDWLASSRGLGAQAGGSSAVTAASGQPSQPFGSSAAAGSSASNSHSDCGLSVEPLGNGAFKVAAPPTWAAGSPPVPHRSPAAHQLGAFKFPPPSAAAAPQAGSVPASTTAGTEASGSSAAADSIRQAVSAVLRRLCPPNRIDFVGLLSTAVDAKDGDAFALLQRMHADVLEQGQHGDVAGVVAGASALPAVGAGAAIEALPAGGASTSAAQAHSTGTVSGGASRGSGSASGAGAAASSSTAVGAGGGLLSSGSASADTSTPSSPGGLSLPATVMAAQANAGAGAGACVGASQGRSSGLKPATSTGRKLPSAAALPRAVDAVAARIGAAGSASPPLRGLQGPGQGGGQGQGIGHSHALDAGHAAAATAPLALSASSTGASGSSEQGPGAAPKAAPSSSVGAASRLAASETLTAPASLSSQQKKEKLLQKPSSPPMAARVAGAAAALPARMTASATASASAGEHTSATAGPSSGGDSDEDDSAAAEADVAGLALPLPRPIGAYAATRRVSVTSLGALAEASGGAASAGITRGGAAVPDRTDGREQTHAGGSEKAKALPPHSITRISPGPPDRRDDVSQPAVTTRKEGTAAAGESQQPPQVHAQVQEHALQQARGRVLSSVDLDADDFGLGRHRDRVDRPSHHDTLFGAGSSTAGGGRGTSGASAAAASASTERRSPAAPLAGAGPAPASGGGERAHMGHVGALGGLQQRGHGALPGLQSTYGSLSLPMYIPSPRSSARSMDLRGRPLAAGPGAGPASSSRLQGGPGQPKIAGPASKQLAAASPPLPPSLTAAKGHGLTASAASAAAMTEVRLTPQAQGQLEGQTFESNTDEDHGGRPYSAGSSTTRVDAEATAAAEVALSAALDGGCGVTIVDCAVGRNAASKGARWFLRNEEEVAEMLRLLIS